MQENEFEIEVYTLTDEDGVESEFELIGTLEIDDQTYVGLVPADIDDESDEEIEFVVLKVVEKDGEEIFETIDDDEEYYRVADAFEDELRAAELEYDEDDEDDGEESGDDGE